MGKATEEAIRVFDNIQIIISRNDPKYKVLTIYSRYEFKEARTIE